MCRHVEHALHMTAETSVHIASLQTMRGLAHVDQGAERASAIFVDSSRAPSPSGTK